MSGQVVASEENILDETNLALSLYSLLAKASKATRKPGYGEGGVTYNRDLVNRRITGNFVLPIDEKVDDETGEVTYKVADSLLLESPENSAT